MIKVLSLFDGISGAAQALKELGIEMEYCASEIDKYAIQVSKNNHPEIKQLGDVNAIDFSMFEGFDLLIGGFPCQAFSGAGKQGGFGDIRGKLFFRCVEALRVIKPRYFIFENVASMKNSDREAISQNLGLNPIEINSALLTAQNRKRLYWTNLNITAVKDRGIYLKDILETGEVDKQKSYPLTASYFKTGTNNLRDYNKACRQIVFEKPFIIQRARGFNNGGIKALNGKTPTLSSHAFHQNNFLQTEKVLRKLTPIECERLQGFPDNYTAGISATQRYKALGNSFTVPVIKHILEQIKL